MSNDSGIPNKHKRRTVFHKKHSVFPGIKLDTSKVRAEAGSIKLLVRRELSLPQGSKTLSREGALWGAFEDASSKLHNDLNNKSSASLAGRNNIEDRYAIASKKLMRAGMMYKIKAKYNTR